MRRSLATWIALLGVASCVPHDVVRSRNGEMHVERFISPRAYEAFVRGRIAEERGRAEEAIDAYRTSIDADPDNTLARLRLAGLVCTTDASEADSLFEEAHRRGDDSAALHLTEGRCFLARKQPSEASQQGFEALVAAPRDPDVVRAVTQLWRDAGHADRSAMLEREAALSGMGSLPRAHDPSKPIAPPAPPPDLEAVDAALLRKDLPLARRFASTARLSPAELALRAAAFGLDEIAREQALLVARADPDDANAAVALVAVEGATLENVRALGAADPKTLSPLGALTLGEIIRRETVPSVEIALPAPATSDRAAVALRARTKR